MDPIANLTEQRERARKIIADYEEGRGQYGESGSVDDEDAYALANLVLALDEWRTGGGFDPYSPPARCRACGASPDEDCKLPVTKNCLHPKSERQSAAADGPPFPDPAEDRDPNWMNP